jgi:hypothetical protein
MNTLKHESTLQEPLLAIGRFGLHLVPAPSGRFAFVGTVPSALAQFTGTETECYGVFKQWFQNLPLENKREYASSLRNDVFVDFAHSGTFAVPTAPTDTTNTLLPPDQLAALHAAQRHFGSQWKSKLKNCWMDSKYPTALQPHRAALQSIRNAIGPTGLNQVKL